MQIKCRSTEIDSTAHGPGLDVATDEGADGVPIIRALISPRFPRLSNS